MTLGAIVVGAHVNGLGIVRALAPRRMPLVAVSTRSFDVAQHSRFVGERVSLHRLHESHDALVELLERNAERWRGWAVYPTNDDALTALARNHERLSRRFRLTVPPWEVVGDLVDKDRTHALAQRVGIDLPVCFGAAGAAVAANPAVRYPVVVKPIQHDRLISAYGTKVFLARAAPQLAGACEKLERVGLAGLVFEFIPGPDSNIYVYCVYIDARGEPSPGVTVRKLRQNPPFTGGARAAEIVADVPGLREATVELLRRAGFRGMAFAEFKLDPRSGRYLFIEVNGRAVLFNGILPPTGVDLVDMAWSDFVLGEKPQARRTDWQGVWVHLQAEIRCWLTHRRVEQLGFAERWRPYLRPKTHAVWAATDPGPFLAQTALAVRGLIAGTTLSPRASSTRGRQEPERREQP